jgi:2-amino-4-hydroxy-6-hydroxymethyldihydropteridine diphosphokinase
MNAAPIAVEVTAFVGIGSNLGDARGNVQHAILQLGKLPLTKLTGQSSLFRTAPVDADGDDYINAVARIDTQLPALQLLQELQAIEQAFGRQRPYRNSPRTLDLDILLYGPEQILSESLIVPHLRLTQRAFALIPLLQIEPFIDIPGKGPAHGFAPGVIGQAIQKL